MIKPTYSIHGAEIHGIHVVPLKYQLNEVLQKQCQNAFVFTTVDLKSAMQCHCHIAKSTFRLDQVL